MFYLMSFFYNDDNTRKKSRYILYSIEFIIRKYSRALQNISVGLIKHYIHPRAFPRNTFTNIQPVFILSQEFGSCLD